MRRIAISDIHGCYKTFQYMLEERIKLQAEDKLYLLGDFIDRGPGSKQVIDLILKLRREGQIVHCLLGNHELMMMEAANNLDKSRRWMFNGGAETMESFQAETFADIHERYWLFLQSLRLNIVLDDYVLVHAGLNFDKLNPLEDQESCVWIRDWYHNIDREWLNGRIIVHGHTVNEKRYIKKRIELQNFEEKPFMDIDAGCCYNKRGMGHLCAFDLDKRTVILQERLDLIV